MTPEEFRAQVYAHMLQTRGKKYRWFLRALRSFKYLPMNPARGEFLESYYTLMRHVDDIVDSDAPLPWDHESAASYVEEKIAFACNPANPKDSVDHLMRYCFALGERFGQEFSAETQDILQSMLFDAQRTGTGRTSSASDLEHHFNLLDIRGTVRATLKVFGEDAHKSDLLMPLGTAVRKYYNLRDHDEDIAAGLVNIPQEDLIAYSISDPALRSPELASWFRDQAREGMRLVEQHRRQCKREFKTLTALVLNVTYERPAQRYFRRVLANS
jgi:phytoene/squalene synthetase